MTHPKPAVEQATKLLAILEFSVRQYGLRTTKAALHNAANNPGDREDSRAVADQARMLRTACSIAGIDQDVLLWGNRVMSGVRGRSTLAGITAALSR